MRRVEGLDLWISHASGVPDGPAFARRGLGAAVDLAMDEPPRLFLRETIALRYPLVDGGRNPPGVVSAAVSAVAGLLQARIPTVVFCSMGLSRSPSVAAGALALVANLPPDRALAQVVRDAPADVSPAMWAQVVRAVRSIRSPGSPGLGPIAGGAPA